ncbi:radical SAM family heme chaperone HemW [Lentisphaera profundi]|uniref:Heme chaperone HemW n=1 Tax=Lentisphaera profundi TaxID=1658616 RepID=A0ABY7VVJ0_9BACT|nr:radical SAM family heme chaperone HemW [Lentisphaera profundi]WDE98087.1 radical SAM family heme chaperone HemW [Lentisphaera profundi]
MSSLVEFDSLYVHVPFCKNICDYCILYSVVENSREVRKAYLDKLESDLNQASKQLNSLKTIFVGGGTPSALSFEDLERLIKLLQGLSPQDEFTIECNPSSVDQAKLEMMYSKGVTRLSFGGQSTSRKTRKMLGRRTGDMELFSAIDLAQKVGFTRINVDLIYGVPGQTLADWQFDVEQVLKRGIRHFSAYSLILEEGSELSKRIHETDDDLAVEMYHLCEDLLKEAGLERYEVSNYAVPGQECRHNLDIWLGARYLGLGPAAASFDGVLRWTEKADLKAWIKGEQAEYDQIPQKERSAEVLAFGFRTKLGWKKERLHSLYGIDVLIEYKEILDTLMTQGLLEETKSSIRATQQGLLFADEIASVLVEYAQGISE